MYFSETILHDNLKISAITNELLNINGIDVTKTLTFVRK